MAWYWQNAPHGLTPAEAGRRCPTGIAPGHHDLTGELFLRAGASEVEKRESAISIIQLGLRCATKFNDFFADSVTIFHRNIAF